MEWNAEKMLALKERDKTSNDLCCTFGAIFRYALETLGYYPMLLYVAPLVLKKNSLRNISYLKKILTNSINQPFIHHNFLEDYFCNPKTDN